MKRLVMGLLLSCSIGAANDADAACQTHTIFTQPTVESTAGNFCVKCNFPPSHFNVVQWESNPGRLGGGDVPTARDLGQKTGFRPPVSKAFAQVSLRDTDVASGAQMAGDTVGAYINSADLKNGSPFDKFIITPNIMFQAKTKAFEGENESSRISVSFDLQVPVAVDQHKPFSSTYVVSDLNFTDPSTHTSFYINEAVFHNGVTHPTEYLFFDPGTKMAVVLGVDSLGSRYSTQGTNSATYQTNPWKGWKHFSYSVDQAQFRAALAAVKAKYPAITLSGNIHDWDLERWHLNAELLFKSGPAEMGWSMRHAAVAVTSCGA